MKIKRTLAAASFVFIVAAIARLISKYIHWKQVSLKGLQANSRIMDTVLGEVEYSVKGDGPPILFAHGSPGGYDQSMVVANLLESNRFTYIAVSRPGYLRTPLQQKSPETQADLYAALLDKLGIPKATIIGASGGGPSALQFALRHSERCSSLILLCAVSQRWSEQELLEALPPIQQLMAPMVERLVLFNNFALFLLESLLRWQHSPLRADLVHSIAMPQLREVGYKNDVEQYEYIGEYPLEQITAPTLVLHGDKDRNVPIKHAEFVASKVPHARFVIDEGGDHLFFLTHREKIAPLLLEFLAEHSTLVDEEPSH